MTRLSVVYFAWVREQIGLDGENIACARNDMKISDLVAQLRARGGGYATALADVQRLRFALDGEMASADTALSGASELAIFPPVTGG